MRAGVLGSGMAGQATARGTEMYLPIWLRLWDALGTGMFNVKVMK